IKAATTTTTSSAAIEARIVTMTRDFFVISEIPQDTEHLLTFSAPLATHQTVCSLLALSGYFGCPAASHQGFWSDPYSRCETPKHGRDSTAPLLRPSRARRGESARR